jgi:hypothetical protein
MYDSGHLTFVQGYLFIACDSGRIRIYESANADFLFVGILYICDCLGL